MTVQPTSAQAFLSSGVQFTAKVQNASNSAVNWLVNQAPGGSSTFGTIDPSGYYTAPGQVPSAPVTVTAVLQSDSSASSSATVTVQSSLTISPARAAVTTSQTAQFQPATAHLNSGDVTWATNGGSISRSGLYSPPGVAGAYTVTASLNANTNVQGQATVYVTDFVGMPTWRNDNARSGINGQELALSPSTVGPGSFGLLFSCPVDGYVYAQPLYVPNLTMSDGKVHNVVFVATTKNSMYAFDADANPCNQLWTTNLVPSGSQAVGLPSLQNATTLMGPFIGITGTPVIDTNASLVYVVAATETEELNPAYYHYLYALDLATGATVRVSGTTITSSIQFNSQSQLQRSALLLDNGSVYVAFGSNGAPDDYHGWLFKFDPLFAQPPETFSVTPEPVFGGAGGGGIWQTGGGPSADKNHNIYAIAGDGPFNVNRSLGSLSYGNSFLRFDATSDLSAVSDYFTPCDQGGGQDVGAGAPVILPDSLARPLLIGGSKNGFIYVVDRDAMGGFCPSAPVETIPAGGPILSTPLFWNNAIYFAPGNNSHLTSFSLSPGTPPPTPPSSEKFGPQGTTPVVSWNASSNDPTTAILWVIDTSGALTATPTPAILRAYAPADLSKELYDSSAESKAGRAVKFTIPTVANGRVYVAAQGELDVYGLLP